MSLVITPERSSSTSARRRPRRLARAAATGVVAVSAGLAAPASADVPEGWSNPDDVDMLSALLLLGGVPLLLFVGIVVLTYLPALVRGEKLGPGGAEDQWFGGPRQGANEVEAGTEDQDQIGGARGSW